MIMKKIINDQKISHDILGKYLVISMTCDMVIHWSPHSASICKTDPWSIEFDGDVPMSHSTRSLKNYQVPVDSIWFHYIILYPIIQYGFIYILYPIVQVYPIISHYIPLYIFHYIPCICTSISNSVYFSDLQIAKSHHPEVGRWGANPKSSEVPSGSTAAAAAAAADAWRSTRPWSSGLQD